MSRKLATVRRITDIQPIPNADAIQVATVDGWKVVVKKDEFKIGDLAIYFEIDSWIPTEIAPFLTKEGKQPSVFNEVKGERLRTIKLRGQLSQGLLVPISVMFALEATTGVDIVGDDVTDALNIQKWERPIPAQLAGQVRGNFPTQVPKTDQERVQNIVKEVTAANETGLRFEITEKLEGSSCTFFLDLEGVFHVCSRNLDLKFDENNAYWRAAIKYDVERKLNELGTLGVAIQGEIVGPGIQDNIYKLSDVQFYVFDIYDVQAGKYLVPDERHRMVEQLGLMHVPVLAYAAELYDTLGITDIPGILSFAEGKSKLLPTQEREGIVFKEVNGGMTFKAISNKYLLNEK